MPRGRLPRDASGNSVRAPAVVIRPILLADCSVNHSAPSGPAVMKPGLLPAVSGNWVTTPAVVIRPIELFMLLSVNHRAPSDPVAMPNGAAPAPSAGNSVIAPVVSIRPIWKGIGSGTRRPATNRPSVNHSAPSGPRVIKTGCNPDGTGNSSIVAPSVVMRPILLALRSVNQSLPSNPLAMPLGVPDIVGIGNWVMVGPLGVTRPIVLASGSVNHRLPSGPATMSNGPNPKSVVSSKVPETVNLPILGVVSKEFSVNHRLPSGPAVIPCGGSARPENSTMVCAEAGTAAARTAPRASAKKRTMPCRK